MTFRNSVRRRVVQLRRVSMIGRGFVGACSLVAMLTMGCAAAVHHDVTACSDVAAMRTYAWITDDPVLIQLGDRQPAVRTQANEQRLRAAIDDALARRGFTRVAREDADLHVAFSVGTRTRYRLEGSSNSWVGGLVPGEKQTKGTLHIYLLQPDGGSEIWHGWTSQWLAKDDDADVVVHDAVTRIAKELPAALTGCD